MAKLVEDLKEVSYLYSHLVSHLVVDESYSQPPTPRAPQSVPPTPGGPVPPTPTLPPTPISQAYTSQTPNTQQPGATPSLKIKVRKLNASQTLSTPGNSNDGFASPFKKEESNDGFESGYPSRGVTPTPLHTTPIFPPQTPSYPEVKKEVEEPQEDPRVTEAKMQLVSKQDELSALVRKGDELTTQHTNEPNPTMKKRIQEKININNLAVDLKKKEIMRLEDALEDM